MPLCVAIYAFPDMEVLDFAGPFEVFTTASRVHGRMHPGQPAPFRVLTVARSSSPIQARAGLRVLPDCTIATCPRPDILLVPGGVVESEVRNPDLIKWVAGLANTGTVMASVCTGAFILARAGLLSGRGATTHWEDIADLKAAYPDVHVVEGKRWVDAGQIVSSAGIAAGIDMSLHLVARLAGAALAAATARQMEFPYSGEA